MELFVLSALVALSYLIYPLYALNYKMQYNKNANISDVPIFIVATVLFFLTMAGLYYFGRF